MKVAIIKGSLKENIAIRKDASHHYQSETNSSGSQVEYKGVKRILETIMILPT